MKFEVVKLTFAKGGPFWAVKRDNLFYAQTGYTSDIELADYFTTEFSAQNWVEKSVKKYKQLAEYEELISTEVVQTVEV